MIPFDQLLESQKRGVIPAPYVIAEAGVNHEGSMDLAKRLIEEAKEGGADAIKFQSYKAHLIASRDSPAYWDRTKEKADNQFELFQRYDAFWKPEFESLKTYCDDVGIDFLSTPFDLESAGFLNDLVDVHKISSSDITNQILLEYISSFGKPILLSTGASTLPEIEKAVSCIQKDGVPLCLMHCILNYPTPDELANLGMIVDLKQRFPEFVTGYSDHTLPMDMSTLMLASMLGASILEKHFTHDKTLPGNDHYHAMDKHDLKVFINKVKSAQLVIGSYAKAPIEQESNSRRHARRSLVAKTSIPAGKVIDESLLIAKRPAHGISPFDKGQVIGKTAAMDIPEDTVISRDMLR